MANMEQIKIQISGDTSAFQKDLNKAFKWAQQKGKTLFGKPQSPGQQNRPTPEDQRAQKELNRKATEAYKKQHSLTGYFNAGSSRAKQTIDMSGDMASLQRGGFYSAIANKVSFAKGAKDWIKGRYKDIKGTTDKDLGGKMPGMPGTGGLPGMGGKGQNMTVNASTVIVNGGKGGQGTFGQPPGGRYPDMGGGNGNGGNGNSGNGNGGNGNGGNGNGGNGNGGKPESALSGASGRIATIAKTLPLVGIGTAIASGLMQLASSSGEQYAAGLERQSGTLGALGGHVGSSTVDVRNKKFAGQGFVSNADIAQGMVSYGKESGKNVYSDKNGSSNGRGARAGNFAMFSASQAESLPAVMSVIAQFEKVLEDYSGKQEEFTNEMLEQMRAESHKAGFKNLKEMEFMKGIADQTSSMRGQGFGSNPMEFAKFVSSLGGLTNERKMSIGKQLDTSGAKGIFGGGLTGQLAMAAALENGEDVFEATKKMETDQAYRAKMMRKGLGMIGAEGSQSDRDTFGMIMKQQGTMSMTEGSNLYTDTSKAQTAHGIRAGQNEALKTQNIMEDAYQQVGKPAFQASQKFAQDMAYLTSQLDGVITATTAIVSKMEEWTFKGATPIVEKMNSFIKGKLN